MLKILVVDDDATLRLTVRTALETRGYQVFEAIDGLEAVEVIRETPDYDAVILDVNMPRMSGIEALAAIKEINPQIFCLVMTAYADVKDAIAAMKHGAYDYLEKPVDSEKILRLIDQALVAQSMVELVSNSAPQLKFDDGRDIVGGSVSIKKVFDVVYKLSKVDTAVLIRGESGTGKELIAQALHFNSHRKKGPYVAINCAAIPENLIESELFGHEKGAFTGADKKKMGKFQYAAGGTLFLDEIGDMTLHMQVKLLRVLQEKKFTPVGSNQELTSDVRIVAATSRPIEEMIKTGSFRPDLFYRLNVLPVHLPPLRERLEDIDSLVEFMIKKFNKVQGRSITGINPQALASLKSYAWPGNIRELENVIERAFIVESGSVITNSSLPEYITGVEAGDGAAVAPDYKSPNPSETDAFALLEDSGDLNFPAFKERFEKEFIIKALKAFNGKINQTAHHTQMTKVTLLRKLEKYGIDPRSYHAPK